MRQGWSPPRPPRRNSRRASRSPRGKRECHNLEGKGEKAKGKSKSKRYFCLLPFTFELLRQMSPPLQAAILGIVQGATEFLPVSSSAHLILARAFFGFDGDKFGLAF